MTSLYEIPVNQIDGTKSSLAPHRGKVALIVNVASACGLTPQYAGLEKAYETYRAQGFEVLGFPANEFGAQEPGTNAEIQSFCSTKFGVEFPMFEKIVVKGPGQHPLYRALVAARPQAEGDGGAAMRAKLEGYGIKSDNETDILWNFEKFLVSRSGEVVARFAPDVTPDDPKLTAAIEAELAKSA
jgi:glutathione peroxidase